MQTQPSFQFVEYLIRKSVFIRNAGNSKFKYEINITPSGIVNTEFNEFQLSLEISLTNKEEESLINVEIVGLYKYTGDLEEVKKFLYLNAPAILFPYLRAYISAMTSLSGSETFTLPTMNLSGLRNELEDNIQILQKSNSMEE